MNTEITKAMKNAKKKQTKKNHPFHKWWRKNEHKILRVIFFPFWISGILAEKTRKYLNSREVWSEERVKEILNYYIPRKAEWSEEDKTFYFFDNGMGWGMSYTKKYLKLKDRRWWNIHRGWVGGKIRSYLIDEFELEGFTKEVGNCHDGWTEISFTMIEKK